MKTEKSPARHGSAYDRGSADRYYSRPFSPHYYQAASYQSIKVEGDDLTPQQLADYSAGWDAECFAKSPNITELKSVGSGIDEAGFVYPQNIDGTFDTSDGVDIHDVDDEWLNTLDDKDAVVVMRFRASDLHARFERSNGPTIN